VSLCRTLQKVEKTETKGSLEVCEKSQKSVAADQAEKLMKAQLL